MLIGVMADTHDNLPKVRAALDLFASRGVEAIVHAGDFVAPFALKLVVGAGLPVVAVLGNNDGEKAGLHKAGADLHAPPHRFRMGGRAVVLAHNPAQLADDAIAGADLVVYGHTHKHEVRQGPPLVVNPGEAGGWLTGVATAAIVDLDAMTAEIVELGPQETVC